MFLSGRNILLVSQGVKDDNQLIVLTTELKAQKVVVQGLTEEVKVSNVPFRVMLLIVKDYITEFQMASKVYYCHDTLVIFHKLASGCCNSKTC